MSIGGQEPDCQFWPDLIRDQGHLRPSCERQLDSLRKRVVKNGGITLL
jgi:hypothetical protein